MAPARPIVLSASRRTDIPAFYMDDFMASIRSGAFTVENPFNGRSSVLPATQDRVAAIVFWSKNYGPFLAGGYGEALCRMGYRLFFNFTVNGPPSLLEPCLPPLAERLEQMAKLCDRFGPDAVQWRFDPICFRKGPDGRLRDNLAPFVAIADRAVRLGLRRCITSFVDLYSKVRKRTEDAGLPLTDPPETVKIAVLKQMASVLAPGQVDLMLCCEKALLERLPRGTSISAGACVPGRWLRDRLGADAPLGKDRGQRTSAGCNCTPSSDIGSYRRHPCPHGCRYCYANPGPMRRVPGDAKAAVTP